MNVKLITLSAISSLALLTACGSLIPPVEIANPLGLDNVEVEATLETEAAPSSLRLSAVGAGFAAKGSFSDFDAPDNPVPMSFEFTPAVKSVKFKSCAFTKDTFVLTFSVFSVAVQDGAGTPKERTYKSGNVGPASFDFKKTASGNYEPTFQGFQGLQIPFIWQEILPIVKLSGPNTPNTGNLVFRISSSENELKGCVLTLTFAGGAAKLRF